MANRYWVGGTGTWDTSSTTHWSASSGGSGGASVPTSADSVFFNANSGGGTVNIIDYVDAASLDCTGFTGTLTSGSAYDLTLYGNLTLGANGIYQLWRAFFVTNATMVSNGTINPDLKIIVQDSVLTLSDAAAVKQIIISDGTLDTNNYDLTVGILNSDNNLSSTFTFGSSSITARIIVIDGADIVNAGTSTINMDYAVFGGTSSWEFHGGGNTYYNLNFSSDSDAEIAGGVYDDNTFHNITNSVQLEGVGFAAGYTQTITGTFGVSGTAGYPFAIRSMDYGSQFTLSKASGTVSCDYLSITDSVATGGADWYAGTHSTNVSNNTGWIFTAPPGGSIPIEIGVGLSIGSGITIG
jgi:hypothetical protein